MTVTIDRTYNFIDTWALTRSQLESLNLGVVIGRGVRGELTLIPFGVSVDECYQRVTALLTCPPAQVITQPSTPVFVDFEVLHAQNRTKGLENTGAIGVKTLENTDKARAEKTVKDEKRLLDQLSLTHSLLQANANLSTSELAQRLGVSRPTARKLLNLDRQGTINLQSF